MGAGCGEPGAPCPRRHAIVSTHTMLRLRTVSPHLAPLLGWLTLAAVMLLGLGGAAASPRGIIWGAPEAAAAIAGLCAVALLLWFLGLGAGSVFLGLSPVPLVLLLAPRSLVPAALTGSPLLALAAGGVVCALWRRPVPGSERLFFVVVLGVYALAAARVQHNLGPRGDEPQYLMVADSLVHDHDLAVEQDFKDGRYRAFAHRPLEPDYLVRGRDGVIYSLHAVGLSLLILPSYALAGYRGASFFTAILLALAAREILLLLRRCIGNERAATGAAWVVALSPPLIHYAGLIFSEIPACLIVALALNRTEGALRRGVAGTLALSSAVAFLPWLNVRYSVIALILLLSILSFRPPLRRALAVVGPAIVSASGIMLYHFVLYGFFDPRRVYGRRPDLGFHHLWQGLPGILLDQEYGLLVYAPVFVLAAAGIIALARRRVRVAITSAGLIVAVVLIAASWNMWRGGFNPPARFLVPIVPALAAGLGAALARGPRAAAALLIGWSLWTGLAGASQPELVHHDRDETAPFFRVHAGAREWTEILPGYVVPGTPAAYERAYQDRVTLALLWGCALVCATLPFGRGRTPLGLRLGVASSALILVVLAAGRLSSGVSEGRDAVRLIGRRALPWCESVATATWDTRDLRVGRRYEGAGATLGNRLRLPSGRYRVVLDVAGKGAGTEPLIELRTAAGSSQRIVGFEAEFYLGQRETETQLRLHGGGPFDLRGVTLARLEE